MGQDVANRADAPLKFGELPPGAYWRGYQMAGAYDSTSGGSWAPLVLEDQDQQFGRSLSACCLAGHAGLTIAEYCNPL